LPVCKLHPCIVGGLPRGILEKMRVLVVTNMYLNPKQPAFGTFVYDQVEALRRSGIDIDVLFINGRQSKWNYLWGVLALWGKLLTRKYDLIHAHYSLSGLVSRLQFLYPVVVTYHGGEVKDHAPKLLRWLAHRGPEWFNRVIVVNKAEKAILKDAGNIRVIPCGVNLDEFVPVPRAEARRMLELPLDKFLVLWAGEYWQREKRFDLVEASMQALKERYPASELILVSGKPHSVIPAYMSACDALLLVSFSEGSPMVIKEAMAINLPIISTDVGDVGEVISGVEGCYLVEPDVEDIVDKLLLVTQRKERTNGREKIGRLSSGQIAEQIIAVYKEVRPGLA